MNKLLGNAIPCRKDFHDRSGVHEIWTGTNDMEDFHNCSLTEHTEAQKSEVGGQRSEIGGQRSEPLLQSFRDQPSEGGDQIPEVGDQNLRASEERDRVLAAWIRAFFRPKYIFPLACYSHFVSGIRNLWLIPG